MSIGPMGSICTVLIHISQRLHFISPLFPHPSSSTPTSFDTNFSHDHPEHLIMSQAASIPSLSGDSLYTTSYENDRQSSTNLASSSSASMAGTDVSTLPGDAASPKTHSPTSKKFPLRSCLRTPKRAPARSGLDDLEFLVAKE